MGKSALRAVLGMQQPVFPSKGGQPPYVRSKITIHTSAKLIAHKTCVGDKLRNSKPGTRAKARAAFKKATGDCKAGK